MARRFDLAFRREKLLHEFDVDLDLEFIVPKLSFATSERPSINKIFFHFFSQFLFNINNKKNRLRAEQIPNY